MSAEHVDVLIVGAGLSGIGAACHLLERCPGKSFAILESRECVVRKTRRGPTGTFGSLEQKRFRVARDLLSGEPH